ncbi:hypothetical protein [Marinobacterium jannaschii]|uniref:hypothetical protein n=1 Tax=Marinobacterium jannaschii TaxID=64970 RepID=UPI0004854272|nr:hypothetical protein [Marinobacterium jannaschii]
MAVGNLPDSMKLTVIMRIEPGCLGPNGDNLVDHFCRFASPAFGQLDTDFVNWQLVPRRDKTLPEFEYHVNKKRLSENQVGRYLSLHNRPFDDFENDMNMQLLDSIEAFQQRIA